MNINSLLPHDNHATQNAASIALERKWDRTGLLEGMSNEVERKGMAVLLENQAKQLVTEANSTGTNANSEEWSGVALPLVRKVFGEIASKDFVSVQPMNLPSGLVFYLNFTYGSGRNDFTKTGKIHGTTNLKDTDATGGFTNPVDNELYLIVETGSGPRIQKFQRATTNKTFTWKTKKFVTGRRRLS